MDKMEQRWAAHRAYYDSKPRPKGVSRKVWKQTPGEIRLTTKPTTKPKEDK